MRFFTKAWLTKELTDAAFEAAPGEYRLHLASLRLPSDVLVLSEVNMLGVLTGLIAPGICSR
ncbi:hypothetical protein [Fimbriiglobus ruber]|uniref:Uncharacterized protein n=1 Tax=Fimbriiglobus ruber TaxID=1908690 RepID=A0A225DU29_9BACT|nr:hypothetical protein [Fimbriiglobus ruber]OWK45010.1 hypothetical protein FRUB_01341 [Fimbriiglobus ruber]